MQKFSLDEIRFSPTSYTKRPRSIGSGVRRALDGTAHRDVVAVKHEFEIGMILPQSLMIQLYRKFEQNSQHVFVDDEGNSYIVVFDDEFGVNKREQSDDIIYSGTQRFVEV